MTWESLISTCMGKMGLSQTEFWQSSLSDLSLMMVGFWELEEQRQHANYERDRLFTLLLLNIQIDKKHRIKKPIDLIEFPWEKDNTPAIKILSKEERQAKFARMDRAMKQKYG